MKKALVAGLLILLVVAIFNSGSIFDKKLKVSSAINNFLASVLNSTGNLQERIEILERENKHLKSMLDEGPTDDAKIKVYSSYPFNNRGEIAIAAGEDMGIKVGDAVVYGDNILVGRVRNVFENSSIVTTIFDPSWEVPVRIGQSETDALMQGGNELKLTLIPGGEYIQSGDVVVVAGETLPYGLEVGFVSDVENLPGEVFQDAILEPSFRINNLRDVSIYR